MLSQLNVEKTQCNIMQEDYKFFFFLKIDTHTQKKRSCSPEDFLVLSDCYIINNLISPL